MKAPCKDCNERCLNCHSSCEEYFQYRYEIMKASVAEYNDSNHKAYVSEACRRMKKRRNKKNDIKKMLVTLSEHHHI